MKLIVGLGNPGSKYERNRHNIGFLALDRIREDHGLPAWRKRFQGLVSDGKIAGERVLLLKPGTYMNDSGRAVREAAKFLKVPLGDVVVLHDELDLPPGKLRVKTGGGNAGHNGLRSITNHLGNDYVRVRLGIGHPGHKDKVAGYVLHDFAKAEADWVEQLLTALARAGDRLAEGDYARFQSDVAREIGDASPSEPGGQLARPSAAKRSGSSGSSAKPKAATGAAASTAAAGSGGGAPSQRALARSAAKPGKPKSKSKRAPKTSDPPAEPTTAEANASAKTSGAQGGALADKLKAWLTGKPRG